VVATEGVRTPWHTPYATSSAHEPSGVRHHANAILREDARGARLSKETKDSPAAHRRRGGRGHGRPPRRRASRCRPAGHLHLIYRPGAENIAPKIINAAYLHSAEDLTVLAVTSPLALMVV
jgi:hypothetical protein